VLASRLNIIAKKSAAASILSLHRARHLAARYLESLERNISNEIRSRQAHDKGLAPASRSLHVGERLLTPIGSSVLSPLCRTGVNEVAAVFLGRERVNERLFHFPANTLMGQGQSRSDAKRSFLPLFSRQVSLFLYASNGRWKRT